MNPKTDRAAVGPGMVVGVTKMAWIYDMSRDWAERVLREWWTEQQLGGPPKVFKSGRRGSLFTTITILNRCMPPGRDPELYRRMKAVEDDLMLTNRRLDRETAERKQSVSELAKRIVSLESRRKTG